MAKTGVKIVYSNYFIQGGARVTVHDTELRPLVDEDGQDVTPAQITSIAVKEVNFRLFLPRFI